MGMDGWVNRECLIIRICNIENDLGIAVAYRMNMKMKRLFGRAVLRMQKDSQGALHCNENSYQSGVGGARQVRRLQQTWHSALLQRKNHIGRQVIRLQQRTSNKSAFFYWKAQKINFAALAPPVVRALLKAFEGTHAKIVYSLGHFLCFFLCFSNHSWQERQISSRRTIPWPFRSSWR